MRKIQRNVDLRPLNTFGVSVKAASFAVISNSADIPPKNQPELILGEGANLLLTKDVAGLVVKNEIKGRKVLKVRGNEMIVDVGSGESWIDFVNWAVDQGLSGIENLAFIPGTVGAAPVQNIAAYGQNVSDVIENIQGFDLSDLSNLRTLSNSDCKFTYRDSIFKHDLRGKFFVTSVVFRLYKVAHFDTNYFGSRPYESLQSELDKIAKPPYIPKQVAQAVTNQRLIKMPDWHKIGTAGSFFKNPFLTKKRYQELQNEVSDLQAYPINKMLYPNPDDPVFKMTDMVKIPAGRLLDVLGWRGKRTGNVGTFEKHALIVVNYGGATGQEILDFTGKMREDVKKHFDINLEPEVIIL